jgi:hypothetical protein
MAINSRKTAKFLSVIGHPLIFGNAYVIFMSFHNLDRKTAFLVSMLVIFLVAVPITWNNLKKIKSGAYSNFDVSDRKERMSFYPFAISLFLLLMLVFLVFDFPREVIEQTLIFFLMVLTMSMVNLKIKASMHAGIAFYIVVNIFEIEILSGFITLIFALAVSWSRWEMGRHDLLEIWIGAFAGVVFGSIGLGV